MHKNYIDLNGRNERSGDIDAILAERLLWWHCSHSTKVISPAKLSCRVTIFIHILALANGRLLSQEIDKVKSSKHNYSGWWG
jgi:hypothetical protein